jgi:hypothetical protein
MGVLSSTSWFIINLFVYLLLFFVVVSVAGRKSMTKCISATSVPVSLSVCMQQHETRLIYIKFEIL